MKIKEIHSSDLTASCPRFVQLRLLGKTRPAATGALFRGLVAGEMLRILHEEHLHGSDPSAPSLYAPIAVRAVDQVRKTLSEEGREPTEAVTSSISEIITDMAAYAEKYVERFGDRFRSCEFLGCEVPVRWKFAPRMPEFASHIDLLLRDQHGRLIFVDWKLRETAPTHAYLSRNLQFACYHAALLEGKVMLNDGLSTEWHHLGEESHGVWFHVGHLLPFGRKTTCEDDRGVEREFTKGEDRPLRMAWRIVEYAPNAVERIRAVLIERAKMFKKDVFPANPDPVGCTLCEAEQFCERFDTVL